MAAGVLGLATVRGTSTMDPTSSILWRTMRSICTGLAAAVVALSGMGCDAADVSSLTYPASPTVHEFGLTERCGPADRSCESAAQDLAAQALAQLGRTFDGDGLTSTDTPPSDRLFIQLMSSSGVPYSSPDGSGRAHEVVFDMTSRGEEVHAPYVVVTTDAGVERFGVDPELAEAMLLALYRPIE